LLAQRPGWRPSPEYTRSAEITDIWSAAHRIGGDAKTLPDLEIENVSPHDDGLLAKGKNTGAAVVVFPSGGYNIWPSSQAPRSVVADVEGICVLLKYRVPDSDRIGMGNVRSIRRLMALQDEGRGLLRLHGRSWH
jgi:hypothetical protein